MNYVQNLKPKINFSRIPEAVLIIMVTTSCVFLAATLLGTCVHEKRTNENETLDLCPGLTVCTTAIVAYYFSCLWLFQFMQGDVSFRNETRDYFCPGHGIIAKSTTKYYNDMATLLFNSQETAIKQLFHQNGNTIIHRPYHPSLVPRLIPSFSVFRGEYMYMVY